MPVIAGTLSDEPQQPPFSRSSADIRSTCLADSSDSRRIDAVLHELRGLSSALARFDAGEGSWSLEGLFARLPHPDQIRTTLLQDTPTRLRLTTESGNQAVGQVMVSTEPSAVPINLGVPARVARPAMWTVVTVESLAAVCLLTPLRRIAGGVVVALMLGFGATLVGLTADERQSREKTST